MAQANILAHDATLSPLNWEHSIALEDWHVPKDHDILSFTLSAVPDGLDAVYFEVGCDVRIRFDAHELTAGKPIPVSLHRSRCAHMRVYLVFAFSKQHLESHGDGDAVLEQVQEYSDEEDYFLRSGTNSVERGRRVHLSMRDTGLREATVSIPRVVFDIKHGSSCDTIVEEFWQHVLVTPRHYTADDLRLFKAKYGLHPTDGTSLEDIGDTFDPFMAKVKNSLCYGGGCVGTRTSFASEKWWQ